MAVASYVLQLSDGNLAYELSKFLRLSHVHCFDEVLFLSGADVLHVVVSQHLKCYDFHVSAT